jgi:glycosyltransferase involved in cell wall biosynthesis
VLFTGYRDDVESLMRFFNALVLTSNREGLPIAILEAMKVGLPVIASSVGGIPKALGYGRYGDLVEPGDIDGLEKIFSEYIKAPSVLNKKALEAISWFNFNYTSDKMAEGYLKQYQRMVR